jgi:hypothetical protein
MAACTGPQPRRVSKRSVTRPRPYIHVHPGDHADHRNAQQLLQLASPGSKSSVAPEFIDNDGLDAPRSSCGSSFTVPYEGEHAAGVDVPM